MAVTVSLYNQTSRLFAEGSINSTDDFKVMLCTAATFAAADTTLGGVTKTEVTDDGYTAGGATLANVTVSTVSPKSAKFDANDVVWTAGATTSITASYAILYSDTLVGDPPLAFIDFGGAQVAGPTTTFSLIWNTSGIFTFTVA